MASAYGGNYTQNPWKKCLLCETIFKSPNEFQRHLRDFHCSKEGGSYVCRYGANNICPSLPLEGVSDMDYENHIARDHVNLARKFSDTRKPSVEKSLTPTSSVPSVVQDQHKWTVYDAKVNLPAALNDPLRRYRKYVRYTQKIEQESPGGETFLQQLEKNRAELQQLPKLFMLPNFDLENTDTFNAVFPWSQVEDSKKKSDQPSSPKSSKLLQEKLSHYLDIVEVHIAKQISTKSDAFFQAVSSHDVLQEQMLKTCQAIKQLRDKVHAIDEQMTQGSLKILKLSQTRANYVSLHNKLKMMATVHQTQPTIQLLLSTNEFVGALDLISTTQEVLSQELAAFIALGIISLFRHLGSQLAELEKLIDTMLQDDFVKCISTDLNRPITDVEPIAEEEKMVSLVFGMIRKNRFNFVDVYREEAFTAIRATVKQTVVEAVSEAETLDSEENVASLGDQMRLLNYNQWMDLLVKIFSNLLVQLNRVKTFHGVISDVIGIAAGKTQVPSPLPSPTHSDKPILEEASHLHVSVSEDAADMMISEADFVGVQGSLNEMMCAACDHAHDRCVKVIVARSKDGFLERLSSSEFVSLSREVENFVNDCESLCGRRSTSLRCSLQSQATKFVSRFHDERRTKLSLILDNERWKQADVPTEFQDLVDHVSKTDRKPGDTIKVDKENFAVVGTVLMLLKMMVEYCQCVDDIPSAAPDLLTRLVDLLKIFNSRTCQLVLGAGALQLVGLKTISTRNLALASRCLQLVVHYMPKVRTHFEDRLIAKNKTMLKHFDQVQKDYSDHINEISNKLVTVMEGVVSSQLVKWEVKAPMPSACFRAICKQLAKMHEALVDILPLDQVKDIFSRINQSFKVFIREQCIKLDVSRNGGPQHGLVMSDLAFYSGTFKTLRGLENLSCDMKEIFDGS
ncbi:hypothetical protein FSP39_003642 [Pinctada imbricata]|uniref:Vacuolar protein sorting-associated protein 54 n=1 Tax=Pinctada imbricata TaxID=66713 RepID=A0AA88XVB1_PINIB|nr:hypothetical protein FSP39_003642 [Pinctada imbricata]